MKVDCGHASLQVLVGGRLVTVCVIGELGGHTPRWRWFLSFPVSETASDYPTHGNGRTWADAYKRGMRAAERTRKVRA